MANTLVNPNFEYSSSYFQDQDKSFSEGVGDFWLETVARGRIVNPEIEIAKINTNTPVCDSEGNLKEDYLELIKMIKEGLKLEKC